MLAVDNGDIKLYFCIQIITMKSLYAILLLLAAIVLPAAAQEGNPAAYSLPKVTNKVYKGFYYFQTAESDSTLMLVLNPITVFPPEIFKNKKQEQYYWRLCPTQNLLPPHSSKHTSTSKHFPQKKSAKTI